MNFFGLNTIKLSLLIVMRDLTEMLRFQSYSLTHETGVSEVFKTIFDESEMAYLSKVQHSGLSFIAKDRKGHIQAFILVQETPVGFTDYEIAFLGVSPRYRRKGYAERLIQMAIDAAGKRGLWLNVMKDNRNACKLYEKLGFEQGAVSAEGITYVYGVRYECQQCSVLMGPATVKWAGSAPHCEKCLS